MKRRFSLKITNSHKEKKFTKPTRFSTKIGVGFCGILLITSALASNVQGQVIAVNDLANYRVFQRDIGGTSKSVTVSGTYSNMSLNRVEGRVLQHGTDTIVVDWTTIDPTPGGGTFSGNLTVPQGGWYNVEVRALDASGSVIESSRSTNKWGVGMIILCIGQSNMSGHGQPPFTEVTSDLAVNYSNAGRWEHLGDPYDDESPPGAVDNDNSTAGGSMIPALANSLLQTFNFPIAFVPSAKDASNLYSQWAYRNPSNHYDTRTLYGQSITKAQGVGGVELIIMHQGEADTNAHRTEVEYEADFATMIGHYRQDLYATIPIFICQLGTISIEGGDPRTDADVVAVRNAQHDLDNGVDIFMAATAMDQPRIDDVHYTTAGLNVIGERVAQTIKYYLGTNSYYRGPAITSAFFADGNRNTVDVEINHRGGDDISPVSGITGFSLLSNESPVSIISAGSLSADRIRLTLASAIPQGTTTKLRYLWGSNPDTSGLVKDNSSLALPLENTTADITVTDVGGGTIQFSTGSYSVNENGGSVTITVTRAGSSSGAVGVSYSTSNGTAVAGSDYTSTSGTLSWANGDAANKTFSVPILDDSSYEGNEIVNLTLSNPTGGATLGSPNAVVLSILDNNPFLVDFDGDGKSDITVWRPGDGYWYTISSKNGSIASQQWGSSALNDVLVPGDYDGDGVTDIAIWRPGDGYWYIISSKDGSIMSQQWGAGYFPYSDIPVPGDYDGDGKIDIAVWRPGDGYWYIISSKDGSIMSQQWGAGYVPYNDIPVPGDYDGDGKTDIAIWRAAGGIWYIISSKDGSIKFQQWGSSALNDVVVPGDYDGDGKTDFAVWRPTEGFWYILKSSDGGVIQTQWGAGYAPYNDVPVPGDYDGDAVTDFAVWRSGDGYWYILKSSDGGVISRQWGWGLDPINDEPISQ